jgi:hypothetical protein
MLSGLIFVVIGHWILLNVHFVTNQSWLTRFEKAFNDSLETKIQGRRSRFRWCVTFH